VKRFVRVPKSIEPTNYKNAWIWFPLEVLLVAKCSGKGKAMSVKSRRGPEFSRIQDFKKICT
jgi:hypothetical protein